MPSPEASYTFTIASGASASGEVPVGGYSFFILEMPAALTGTTLAVHHVLADGTYAAVVNDLGAAVTVTFTASSLAVLSSDSLAKTMAAASAVKFVSDGSEAAERTFTLYMKR